MHILLTDRLACPRCGPGFGLILLAREARDRRVLQGDLGCPNCRETYPVRDGFADLRPPPRPPLAPAPAPEGPAGRGAGKGDDVSLAPAPAPEGPGPLDAPDDVMRLGALLGVTEGPGMLLLKGPVARHGRALADLIGQVEVVVMDPELREEEEREGVSRLVGGFRIPFFSETFRGVVLSGAPEGADVEEACRVVAPLGRVVVLQAPPDTAGRLEALGFSALFEQEGVVVARRDRSGSRPLTPLRGPHGLPTLP